MCLIWLACSKYVGACFSFYRLFQKSLDSKKRKSFRQLLSLWMIPRLAWSNATGKRRSLDLIKSNHLTYILALYLFLCNSTLNHGLFYSIVELRLLYAHWHLDHSLLAALAHTQRPQKYFFSDIFGFGCLLNFGFVSICPVLHQSRASNSQSTPTMVSWCQSKHVLTPDDQNFL